MILLLAATGFILLALNILVSLRSFHDSSITSQQRVLQLLIIWLLPFVGALFISHLLRSAHSKAFLEDPEWRNSGGLDEDIPHT